eukprot:1213325-Pyramimonas_sp.AAC.1
MTLGGVGRLFAMPNRARFAERSSKGAVDADDSLDAVRQRPHALATWRSPALMGKGGPRRRAHFEKRNHHRTEDAQLGAVRGQLPSSASKRAVAAKRR